MAQQNTITYSKSFAVGQNINQHILVHPFKNTSRGLDKYANYKLE
jgi:hypothetical protein